MEDTDVASIDEASDSSLLIMETNDYDEDPIPIIETKGIMEGIAEPHPISSTNWNRMKKSHILTREMNLKPKN